MRLSSYLQASSLLSFCLNEQLNVLAVEFHIKKGKNAPQAFHMCKRTTVNLSAAQINTSTQHLVLYVNNFCNNVSLIIKNTVQHALLSYG